MKVYPVGTGEYDEYRVVHIFTDKKHAHALKAVYDTGQGAVVEEWETTDEDVSDRVVWEYVHYDGYFGPEVYCQIETTETEEHGPTGDAEHCRVYVFARSFDEAVAKGQELVAKFLDSPPEV